MSGRAEWLVSWQRDATAAGLSRSEFQPGAVRAVLEDAIAFARRFTDDLRDPASTANLACAAGCSWCCHTRVATTVPEVLRIARWLTDHACDSVLDSVRRQVQESDRRPRDPCPLLDGDGRCVAHGVRPLRCRGWNGFDAEACEGNTRGERTNLSVEGIQWQVHRDVAAGLGAGIEKAGFEAGPVELAAALRLTLNGDLDRIEARWHAGEKVLNAARPTRASMHVSPDADDRPSVPG